MDTSDPATRAGASPARICSAPGRPRAARTAVQSPRSLTTATTATFSDDMPRERLVPVRVRPPRHPRAPARERLVQVQLVGLRGHPVAAAHRLELRAHRLEDPHPHEPAGLDAHAAARGGARQALAGGHPLDVGRPGGGGELGEREHAPGRRRERPTAAAAQPALGAAGQRRQDRGLQVGDEPLHALDAQGPCPL